jgi:hypothetical protein
MWECKVVGCREIFASEGAFIDHMIRKHEQRALDIWLQGDIFNE